MLNFDKTTSGSNQLMREINPDNKQISLHGDWIYAGE